MSEMTDEAKAVMLTFAMAAIESVRADEKPKSARLRRLDNAYDRMLEMISIYQPDMWNLDMTIKVDGIIRGISSQIQSEFIAG